MKIIIRNPNDDTNAKFKLKALADGIITVNAPVGAIIKNEDNEWLTCLSAASTLISCAGASNKLFVPFDFTPHIADKPAGLESFWDWSLNGGYGDTPYGGWEAVFNSMREDDKIVDWDIYVDEIKIGTTHIVPLSRLNKDDPGYDENEMDLWFNEILSTVKGLGVYYPDAINPNEINADIETFFNGIVQTDGIDVVMPHKTIRALYGLVLVNKTNKPMRIKFVPSNPLVTMGDRWKAGFGIRPHSLTENYAYLLDLQPLAETIRGNDAVTVDPIDGSISVCLEVAPIEIPMISCADAGNVLDLRVKLWRNEGGGGFIINDPITGERIADGFGYYADGVKPIANFITVNEAWADKLAVVDHGNTFYNDDFTIESSVGVVNLTNEPLRLEIVCKTTSPGNSAEESKTDMHVGDSTTANVDENYGTNEDIVNVCLAPGYLNEGGIVALVTNITDPLVLVNTKFTLADIPHTTGSAYEDGQALLDELNTIYSDSTLCEFVMHEGKVAVINNSRWDKFLLILENNTSLATVVSEEFIYSTANSTLNYGINKSLLVRSDSLSVSLAKSTLPSEIKITNASPSISGKKYYLQWSGEADGESLGNNYWNSSYVLSTGESFIDLFDKYMDIIITAAAGKIVVVGPEGGVGHIQKLAPGHYISASSVNVGDVNPIRLVFVVSGGNSDSYSDIFNVAKMTSGLYAYGNQTFESIT